MNGLVVPPSASTRKNLQVELVHLDWQLEMAADCEVIVDPSGKVPSGVP